MTGIILGVPILISSWDIDISNHPEARATVSGRFHGEVDGDCRGLVGGERIFVLYNNEGGVRACGKATVNSLRHYFTSDEMIEGTFTGWTDNWKLQLG